MGSGDYINWVVSISHPLTDPKRHEIHTTFYASSKHFTDEFFARMQLSHYILGVLSLQMSRDIHYGDKSCYAKNTSNLDLVAKCTGISDGEK